MDNNMSLSINYTIFRRSHKYKTKTSKLDRNSQKPVGSYSKVSAAGSRFITCTLLLQFSACFTKVEQYVDFPLPAGPMTICPYLIFINFFLLFFKLDFLFENSKLGGLSLTLTTGCNPLFLRIWFFFLFKCTLSLRFQSFSWFLLKIVICGAITPVFFCLQF